MSGSVRCIFATTLAFALVGGCQSDEAAPPGRQGSTVDDIASSLTRSLDLADSTVELGDLPDATSPATRVEHLAFGDGPLDPGGTARLELDVADPDGRAPEAVLLQFEAAYEHLQAPLPAGAGDAHVQLEATIGADACDGLCNVEHPITMTVAVTLEGGDVSNHATLEITLDCTTEGSAEDCVRIDEEGAPFGADRGGASEPAGGGGTGSGAGSSAVPAEVDVAVACDHGTTHCPGAFDGDGTASDSGPRDAAECVTGVGCLFENASDACADLLTRFLQCLEAMGPECGACASIIVELDASGDCVAAEEACFGASGGSNPDPGSGGAAGGTGGSGATADGCADFARDKPVSDFTEAEAAALCRCGYAQRPDLDAATIECTTRAVFTPMSTPTQCEASVAQCLANPVVCDGAEQLGFLRPCQGTYADLEACFAQSFDWTSGLDCADAGGGDPCADPSYPQCLKDLCGACSGT